MDPHSRFSQFNHRPTRSAPSETMNLNGKGGLSSTGGNGIKNSAHPYAHTNSNAFAREKARAQRRDSKYQHDMYRAFVDNALSKKAKGVNKHYDDLVRRFSLAVFSPSPSRYPSTPTLRSQSPQPPPVSPAELRAYLSALAHGVSRLDPRGAHGTLVDAAIRTGTLCAVLDAATARSYAVFAAVLVSARPECAKAVLECAVDALTYNSARRALSNGLMASNSTPASISMAGDGCSNFFALVEPQSPLTRCMIYERVHTLIAQLLSLVPTLPATLFPILVRYFPHKRQSQAEHVTYVRNLLRVSDYCPELWESILGLIVDRTIQIDVEIQVELEEIEAGAEEQEEVFNIDVFDTIVGQEGDGEEDEEEDEDEEENEENLSDLSSEAGSDSDEDKAEQGRDMRHVQQMVSKLDSILNAVFKYLSCLHKTMTGESDEDSQSWPTRPPSVLTGHPAAAIAETKIDEATAAEANELTFAQRRELAESHLHALLTVFERTILRTFRSRYTQFLVFWCAARSSAFCDRFLGTLVTTALIEPQQPVVARAAAVSYVASFVSRACFVGRAETQMVVRVLCQFVQTHLDEFDLAASGGVGYELQGTNQSAEQHAVFYATVQAAFLIFCFRWRDLMGHDAEEADAEGEGERDALNLPVGGRHAAWIPPLSILRRAVHSPLNPLKVCLSNVVQQFARVTQHVGFMYCYPIIEANRRSEYSALPPVPSPSGSSSLGQKNGRGAYANPITAIGIGALKSSLSPNSTALASSSDCLASDSAFMSSTQALLLPPNPLAMPSSSTSIAIPASAAATAAAAIASQSFDADLTTFFPFDPYRLPRSATYLEGMYREWGEVAIPESESESEDDDDEGEDDDERAYNEDEDAYMHGPSSFIDGAADLGGSFGGMSISPAPDMPVPMPVSAAPDGTWTKLNMDQGK